MAELPLLKFPPAVNIVCPDTTSKSCGFFLEAPPGCAEVLSFRVFSTEGTVDVTYQRRSCIAQGYTIQFEKNALAGVLEDRIVLFYREGKLGSREKLTAGYFAGCQQYVLPVHYLTQDGPFAPKTGETSSLEAVVGLAVKVAIREYWLSVRAEKMVTACKEQYGPPHISIEARRQMFEADEKKGECP